MMIWLGLGYLAVGLWIFRRLLRHTRKGNVGDVLIAGAQSLAWGPLLLLMAAAGVVTVPIILGYMLQPRAKRPWH